MTLSKIIVRHCVRFIATLSLMVLFLAARPAAATIDYKVSLAHPEKHRFEVEMQVPVAPPQQNLVVALARVECAVSDSRFCVSRARCARHFARLRRFILSGTQSSTSRPGSFLFRTRPAV